MITTHINRNWRLSNIAAAQGSRIGWNKFSFSVLLFFLLTLITFPRSTKALISAKNISWEPIQRPTISGGTISQIIIDPLNPSHIFAFQKQQDLSCILFESQDAAVNWNPIYTFQENIENSSIDPFNPSVLYSATSASILRSVNSGRNWEKIADFSHVIASPAADTIYSIETMAYSENCPTGNINFVKSLDGGGSWEKYPLGCYYIHQIATTYSFPEWIYIRAEADFSSTLYRSNDGGDTWSTIPLTGTWFTDGFLPIVVDPSQPEKLYTSSGSGIIISMDGGMTWQSVLDVPIAGPFRFTFSGDVIYAGVDPTLYGELPVIYRSIDAGETWETLPWTVPDGLNDLQAVCCSLVKILTALNGFGVYQSVDSGESWQPANDGMRSTVIVEKLAISPSTPDTIYAISHWPRNALIKTTNGGQTWGNPLLETLVLSLAVHPNNPNILWVADSVGILESDEGGGSWVRVSTFQVNYISVSADAPDRPCAVGNYNDGSYLLCRVMNDQEYQWTPYLIPGVQNVGHLTLSPIHGNLMMLGGMADSSSVYSIFSSQDNGLTWEEVFQGPKDYWPLNLSVSGGQPARALAVFFQAHPDNLLIYQSLDAGESWQDITSQLEAAGGEMWTGWTYKAPVIYDNQDTTYFGTRDLVLQQMSDGRTWKVVWNEYDLLQDMIILPGSQDFLLISSKHSLWKSRLPVFRSIWMPILLRQP